MKIILLTVLAGVFGTLLRFGCVRSVNHLFPDFPWGTLAVNVAGAFAAGFLFILCREKFQGYEAYFPVVFLGFLGAFTTFSSFALESVQFLFAGEILKFTANVCLQNVTGIGAAAAGFILGRMIFS